MLRLLLALIFFSLVSAHLRAELTIVSAQHRDADSFKRVSEYLTGEPSDGRYTIYRSDDSSRDGFYVSLLASDRSVLAKAETLRIQFVRTGTQEIDTFQIPAKASDQKRILVGFTGEEWQEEAAYPIAWKIDLLNANGDTLESAQSFLWAEPNL